MFRSASGHSGAHGEWSAQEHDAAILHRVVTQEMKRAPGDLRFRLSLADYEVMILAPADTFASPAPYLTAPSNQRWAAHLAVYLRCAIPQ